MEFENPAVWECEHENVINACPEVIWRLFEDVAGWPQWNAGIEKIELRGAFEAGTWFTMTPPGQEPLETRLWEVRPNLGFVDETRVGDLRVFVDHRIEVLESGRTRVVFSIEVFGPSCEEIGPLIAADFPDVLKALAARAEILALEAV